MVGINRCFYRFISIIIPIYLEKLFQDATKHNLMLCYCDIWNHYWSPCSPWPLPSLQLLQLFLFSWRWHVCFAFRYPCRHCWHFLQLLQSFFQRWKGTATFSRSVQGVFTTTTIEANWTAIVNDRTFTIAITFDRVKWEQEYCNKSSGKDWLK